MKLPQQSSPVARYQGTLLSGRMRLSGGTCGCKPNERDICKVHSNQCTGNTTPKCFCSINEGCHCKCK
jgi:hypothetical protein